MREADRVRTGFAWSLVLGAGIVVASAVSSLLLVVFTALVTSSVSFFLGKKLTTASGGAGPLAAAVGAASFPILLFSGGESGVLWAVAVSVVCVAAALLLSRPGAGATREAAALIWLPLLLGLGLSYSVLIRHQGRELLWCAGLILVAYKGSEVVAARFARAPAGEAGAKDVLPVRVAGIAAAEVAAMVSLLFLDEPFTAGPLVILGLVVAFAAMLGEACGRMISAESPAGADLPPLAALDAWFLALPAFFYGFRLYLT